MSLYVMSLSLAAPSSTMVRTVVGLMSLYVMSMSLAESLHVMSMSLAESLCVMSLSLAVSLCVMSLSLAAPSSTMVRTVVELMSLCVMTLAVLSTLMVRLLNSVLSAREGPVRPPATPQPLSRSGSQAARYLPFDRLRCFPFLLLADSEPLFFLSYQESVV